MALEARAGEFAIIGEDEQIHQLTAAQRQGMMPGSSDAPVVRGNHTGPVVDPESMQHSPTRFLVQ